MIDEINPADALAALGKDSKAKLIDVRTDEEFTQVHATGAVHIVLNKISRAALAAAGIKDPATNLYLICKAGGRSRQACQMLAAEGFTNLHNVSGGTMAWVEEDLPHE
ncbi:MAG: rhodanese-like domain-containing protein [Proteobacteria bacterium]|jgi:rhodanese-related sulfurtransferase|nr:rhodanese-like domain-containing protein [Pseudomonadota bacterium]